MALNPIDLQTMYSQIDKVAKQASFMQQGVQLSESMQQVNVVRQNTEQAKVVHSADESSNANTVNQNGSGNNEQPEHRNQEKEQNPEGESHEKYNLKEAYLGNHVDISR